VVGGQVSTLTHGPSFGYNLCFKYTKWDMRSILDIYVSRAFQCYKKLFNLMSFDLCNCSLKIQKFIETLTPKVGTHLGVCGFIPSHPSTFPRAWNVTPGLHFQHVPLQAFAFVTSPKPYGDITCIFNKNTIL